MAHSEFINVPGVQIGIVPQILWSKDPLSAHKTCNGLPYIQASIQAEAAGWDTGLLLNDLGHVTEACAANVWIVQGDQLLTPPLSDGPLKGTMRQFWLEHADQIGLQVKEAHILPEELNQAQEIWLTNSIRGVRWVARMENRNYDSTFAQKAITYLNQYIEVV